MDTVITLFMTLISHLITVGTTAGLTIHFTLLSVLMDTTVDIMVFTGYMAIRITDTTAMVDTTDTMITATTVNLDTITVEVETLARHNVTTEAEIEDQPQAVLPMATMVDIRRQKQHLLQEHHHINVVLALQTVGRKAMRLQLNSPIEA